MEGNLRFPPLIFMGVYYRRGDPIRSSAVPFVPRRAGAHLLANRIPPFSVSRTKGDRSISLREMVFDRLLIHRSAVPLPLQGKANEESGLLVVNKWFP